MFFDDLMDGCGGIEVKCEVRLRPRGSLHLEVTALRKNPDNVLAELTRCANDERTCRQGSVSVPAL